MYKPSALSIPFAISLLTLSLGCHAQTMTRITSLGTLDAASPHTMAQAQGVSADGGIVVGYGTLAGNNRHDRALPRLAAFRWTPAAGMTKLAFLPGGGEHAAAEAISANGKVIVGVCDGTFENGRYLLARAVRWEADGAAHALTVPPDAALSTATGVSNDGATIAGFSADAQGVRRALRWSSDGAMRDLGSLGGRAAYAAGVSHGGKHIVGVAQNAARQARAFLWSERDGMKDLGTLPGLSGSEASAVSADGSVVVGSSANGMIGVFLPEEGAIKGYIWRRTSGAMQEIVNTLGGDVTMPTAVSDDGKVVVGVATDGHERRHVFRWTQENGMTADTSAAQRMVFVRGLSKDGRYGAGRLASDAAFRAQWF
ncbi:hypothetical protein [Paludibacterium purpuratum]|uniref:Putative HAF family extracellular repeat protein n=1 Tax=Paludibacterium purpuratum TaxID=1144873 RepID=A0A4R7B6G2_9NEIS|nr:hypothetical protein [Paludibacterium purpuratum]TDR80270.1 putative HAF family extracellular repeat protein [Paludibacterium purpuratum]